MYPLLSRLIFFIAFDYVYVHVFVRGYVHMCEYRYPQKPEVSDSLGLESQATVNTCHGCWEQNSGPLCALNS